MALLDVTDVLLDPDFMDLGIICCRQDQVVGDDGRATNTETQTPFAGVVTSDSGDLLRRLADGSLINGTITIHTTYRLQDGGPGRDADEVIWQGNRYTVSNVNNYSHFGRGFVAATCDLKPLSG